MTQQIELFPPYEFVDYSCGMTDKSTRRKKRSPSSKVTIALQTKPLTVRIN